MQLRYNVSQIEEFLLRRGLKTQKLKEEIEPLTQIAQLMQVRKRDENDAEQILKMCDKLTGARVSLLIMYLKSTNASRCDIYRFNQSEKPVNFTA